MPMGFVALGDAVCALCPVYGQGMTVSALAAMVLKDWLGDKELVPSRFQKSLAKSNALHWMLATGQDSRFLTTAGRVEPSLIGKLFGWYSQKAIVSAGVNADMHKLFVEVSHLLKSPLALYHPQVVLQVLTGKQV